jgi:relaxase/mobilisation nuclease domain
VAFSFGKDGMRMAATRLIALHVNKGKTVAQCLADRTDYSQNAEKTNDGEFISSYECDPKTADEEFLLSKRQYQHITGREHRNNIIAYQIRQSFKPGEITPEEANRIGYETAMRWTKGNHAFFVATHIDKAHIHNHIIYNSTSLDCTKKFRNFIRSGLAVQRLSDIVCLENGLSVITPKPYKERIKRTVFPKKRTYRDELCEAIDLVLKEKPKTFDGFIQLLAERGFVFKDGKQAALKGQKQKRFIRLSSLGDGYSKEELQAVITGKSLYKSKSNFAKTSEQKRFHLLIDIQSQMAEGKTTGYEKWAKKYNRKEAARTVCLLKEKGIDSYEDLTILTDKLSSRFTELTDSIKNAEKRMVEIKVLQTHINNYYKTRQTYVEYRKSGYSKKFFEEHRDEISIHKAAKQAFDQLEGKKIPSRQSLHEEFNQLILQKKQEYAEYRQVKKEMQEYLIAKQTVETILNIDRKKEKGKEMIR